jgi:hypothetical protein
MASKAKPGDSVCGFCEAIPVKWMGCGYSRIISFCINYQGAICNETARISSSDCGITVFSGMVILSSDGE